MAAKRPKNLNLFTIRLPLPALVSIMHRASGAFLFLLLPLLLLLLQQSLTSSDSYAEVHALLKTPFLRLIYILIIWAYLHHALAGLRHLALDAHWGLNLRFARASSMSVLIISGLLTVLMAFLLW
ncbi:MAG: succinate dehydrogenase, cytochrome b556 subunit [Methylophilaceae bacterium]|nr:succinate dehydrogenase, cytochrome b556 subunit [Methyloradius sp.]